MGVEVEFTVETEPDIYLVMDIFKLTVVFKA